MNNRTNRTSSHGGRGRGGTPPAPSDGPRTPPIPTTAGSGAGREAGGGARAIVFRSSARDGDPPGGSADPLADYYGALLPWLDRDLADRGDLDWWRERIRELAPARILELGCGTGRVTRVLAGGGRTVVGLDRVPAMLRIARERLEDLGAAHVVRGDLRAPPVRPAWDLVIAADDPFIHLRRDRDRQRALDACARLLAPDGRLIVDLLWWTPGEVRRARSPGGLRKARESATPEGTLLVEERWRLDPDRRTVTATYRYQPRNAPPTTASFRGIRWTLPELRHRLDRAGLQVVRRRGGYDDRPFEPEEAGTLLVEARRSADSSFTGPVSSSGVAGLMSSPAAFLREVWDPPGAAEPIRRWAGPDRPQPARPATNDSRRG